MTQLGEMVAVGVVSTADIDCPFHDDEHDCSRPGKNEFEGDATALGKSIVSGASTVVRTDGPDIRHKAAKTEADPDNTTEESREISILTDTADKDKKENCIYPVAFSAHHLIPAAESLKRAPGLHKFMQKSKGKICCDLGYDVNGNENGVWLPGLHAVNGKGLNLWGSAPTSLPDKEEVGRRFVKRAGYRYSPLRGPRPGTGGASAFQPTNMKWMYVQKAMAFLGPRQFHDRHANYSRLVKEQLMAVGRRLETFYGLRKDPDIAGCAKCRSRNKKLKPPPPVQLLGLLNRTSGTFLLGHVKGKTHDDAYYTSSWCGPLAKTASAVKIVSPKKPKGK